MPILGDPPVRLLLKVTTTFPFFLGLELKQVLPDPRLTEFYDNYLDSYTDDVEPPLPTIGSRMGTPDRVAAWARSNANPPGNTLRSARSAPSSQYAPSSFGGSSVRRKLTRRTTNRSRAPVSMYEEEEEGYVSGEYEDGPFELVKIRVKVRYINIPLHKLVINYHPL